MRQTRTAFDVEAMKLARRGGLTIEALVAGVHKNHQKAINRERVALVEHSLRNLASEKINLRPPKTNRDQLDLFESYGISSGTLFAVPDENGGKLKHVGAPSMTLAEARRYIEDNKPVLRSSRKFIALERIVKAAGPDADGNMKLVDCLKAQATKISKDKD